jgi:hypothetical protein
VSAKRGRVLPMPLPANLSANLDGVQLGWMEKGRLVAQQRGKAFDNEKVRKGKKSASMATYQVSCKQKKKVSDLVERFPVV